MKPSTVLAPCSKCGVFPGAIHGYECLCVKKQDVEDVARALRASREFINQLPLIDGASKRAKDREFITVELIPQALTALARLKGIA